MIIVLSKRSNKLFHNYYITCDFDVKTYLFCDTFLHFFGLIIVHQIKKNILLTT